MATMAKDERLARTRSELDRAKIIFNHVPKAGGSTLHFFFQELFGPERVFRYQSREVTEDTKTMESLTEEEKAHYKLFQGHFRYGYHSLFSQPCLYIGIIRHPVDRIISNYYYTLKRGREDRMQKVQKLTLTEYFEKHVNDRKGNFGAVQTGILTGESRFAEAREVIKRDYLMCCATDQLDRFQAVLARLYGRPDLAPMHRNVTNSGDQAGEEGQALREKYEPIFQRDLKLLEFVRNRFERVYDKLQVAED